MSAPSPNREFRLVQVNDPHLDVTGPSSRKDDYLETMKAKLEDVLDFCNGRSVNAVVFTGDIFNKQEGSRVPYRLTDWVLAYLTRLAEICPVLLIPGNHDILRRSVLDNQPIQLLYRVDGVMHPGESTTVLSRPNGVSVNFSGNTFYYGIDTGDRAGYQMKARPDCDFNVKIVHGMLLPDGERYFDSWTNPSDLPLFEGDLILCGHYHDDLGVFPGLTPSNHHFLCVNGGALSRGSVAGFNLRRDPKFAFIRLQVEPVRDIQVEFIVPPSAKPPGEVFDFDQVQEVKESSAKMKELATSLLDSVRDASLNMADPDSLFSSYVKELDLTVASKAKEIFIRAKEQG